MQANDLRDQLVQSFTENYVEKLFFFCLKKTGNQTEAEDLTQDIALNVIHALNLGTIPTSFSAWVWQIARNRYSAWAAQKHHHRASVTGSDIGDYEIADERWDSLSEMLHSEQLSLLRRELAFIRRDYRDIVVAYYIENQSIRDIASSLSLSVSAVQQRLHRARILLKEGMDMAREFGKRSYKPENITFAASGSQPSGLPWSAVQRSIPKNILLQANNNPSTAEELSIELGVALPYMEEEIELLYHATLLAKQGDRYITNFFILDKDLRMEVYHILRNGARERSRLIREFIDDKLDDIRALGIAEAHIDDNTVRWWLVPKLIDLLIVNIEKKYDIYGPPKRANGESWGFIGYEITELPEPIFIGQNGMGDENNMFWAYKYGDYDLWEQCGQLGSSEALFLCDCLRTKRLTPSFTDTEKRMWETINGNHAHASASGEIIPDILVFKTGDQKKIHQFFREHESFGKLFENVEKAYAKIAEAFKKCSHELLHNQLGYHIEMELCNMRMLAVHDLVDDQLLKLPEDPHKSTLGMYLTLI